MTNITKPTAAGLKKWRQQAAIAAGHIKSGAVKAKPGEAFIKVGFVFDDDQTVIRPITLEITPVDVARMTPAELATHIYDGVLLKAQEHTPPAGHA